MRKDLAIALSITDLAFLAYWLASSLEVAGILHVPPSWMYADFDHPQVIAWNWSFLPIDLGFSVLGLAAVITARRDNPVWRPLALLSLAFTVTAGLMAVSYWVLLGEFNPSWFLPNLLIAVWPLFYAPGLIVEIACGEAARAAS